ncbi:MAG: hypothetical protein ACRD16_08985 [Thermoanaerobaculia bacterium]
MGPITSPMSRAEAIGRLREALVSMTDDEHSMCRVATEKGIYCQGFRRLSEGEFRRRHDWLASRTPTASREEIEALANQWQLARQIVDRVPLACDAQLKDHDTCDGWNEFTNVEIEGFCREILHRNAKIG